MLCDIEECVEWDWLFHLSKCPLTRRHQFNGHGVNVMRVQIDRPQSLLPPAHQFGVAVARETQWDRVVLVSIPTDFILVPSFPLCGCRDQFHADILPAQSTKRQSAADAAPAAKGATAAKEIPVNV